MTLGAALLVAGIGVLIGTVGLGGFLMVPVLLVLEGISVRQAVVVAAVAFLASGVVSLALSRRGVGGTADVRPYRAFFVGAAPGAMLGALAVGALVDSALTLLIAVTFLLAGIAEWLQLPRSVARRPFSVAQAGAGGAVTGFGSALTGTSGPMIAMPLLAFAGLTMRERVTLGQVAQIPVALGATLMFASLGDVPWGLAALCSALLCVGLLGGALCAPWVRIAWLRRLAAVLMVGAAASMLLKL